jgi:NADP-dependent 3-hydroxy acid dehydrogenase YdfG
MTLTCVVTGATGGIGGAVVEAFADRGHRVLALGRSPAKLEALASGMANVVPLPVDFAGPIDWPRPLRELERLDVLVHCAGIADVASVEEMSSAVWEQTFGVNVVAAADLTRLTLPALRRARGHVVFLNISAGMRAVPRWSAYVGSKAALRELADSLREEEAPHGVRVTTVYPNGTATDLLERVRSGFGRTYDAPAAIQPKTLARVLIASLDCPPDVYVTELSVRPTPEADSVS